MTEPDVRKGMPAVKLSRALPPTACYFAWGCFRYFLVGSQSDATWLRTQKPGAGFADPEYDIASDWLVAHKAIVEAQQP
jgi:hypothetical protein